MIRRGFKELRERAKESRLRSFACCDSCYDLYRSWDEKEDRCHNSESTEFDVVEDGGRVFCSFWNCKES